MHLRITSSGMIHQQQEDEEDEGRLCTSTGLFPLLYGSPVIAVRFEVEMNSMMMMMRKKRA